jgi:hypothetical protein
MRTEDEPYVRACDEAARGIKAFQELAAVSAQTLAALKGFNEALKRLAKLGRLPTRYHTGHWGRGRRRGRRH